MKNNKGFGHIEALLALVLIAAIVFSVWFALDKRGEELATVGNETSKATDESEVSDKGEKSDVLSKDEDNRAVEVGELEDNSTVEGVSLVPGSFDGALGAFQAKGYMYTESFNVDPGCTSDCERADRAFFRIVSTPNDNILNFISERQGNSYVGVESIAIGCKESSSIEYSAFIVAGSSPSEIETTLIDESLYQSLVLSSESNLVALEAERFADPAGGGAPSCFSHFGAFSKV